MFRFNSDTAFLSSPAGADGWASFSAPGFRRFDRLRNDLEPRRRLLRLSGVGTRICGLQG
jgi:hypothetical protein